MAIFGFGSGHNWLASLRSWITVLITPVVSLILVAAVVFVSSEHIKTVHSPDGHYQIDFYAMDGGAATSPAVIGKLNGPLWFTKVIYDDSPADEANVKWKTNSVVSINGTVLNVKTGQVLLSRD